MIRTTIAASRKFPLKELMRSTVKVSGSELPVWVMNTPAKRAEGYMFLRRQDAPDNSGMLFVFPETETRFEVRGFFMRNCRLDLDIAFIGPDKVVVNVARGKMFDESNIPAAGPYKYVLELKAGEAVKFGVMSGAKIAFPAELETKQ